jgi:phage portal protein BeeE
MMWADDERLDPAEGVEQAKLVKTKWNEEYSGPDNAGKVVISGIKMGGMPIGKSPVELGIIDTEQWDSLMLCNVYDVPPELLGLTAKTYNNVIEAQKALILGAVMPLLISRRNALNWKLQTDWGFKDKNIYCDFETDCFPELMPNTKEIVEASNGIMMITPNEQREMINMEARPEPEADEVWIKQDRTPLSDYEASIVDNALNASNGTGNGNNGQTNVNGNGVSQNGKSRVPLS